MKKLSVFLFFIYLASPLFAQLQSPAAFLGRQLGEQFTPHYKVLEYVRYLASASKNIKLKEYGKTYEGRPLLLAFIASDENIARLDEIQRANIALTSVQAEKELANQPALIWLSYNVHGNEAVSTEAGLQTLYYFLNPDNANAKKWLKNTVLIIDPCLNPDGRERYVNFYNSVRNLVPDPQPYTREHIEPWPGGRTNHYYFDLNRDWAWQTQAETQQRMAVYNSWLPQVHVDFHEQGYNEPYYFAPAAEPFHQDITKWQRQFQTIIGKNNAKYFDQKGWLYFTKERFDLLYPSYGDTYPTYNGAIGMTYEQGGSGRAGLSVLTKEGDLLTLASRIEHHHAAGLSTIEAASANAPKVVSEFRNYFTASRTSPSGTYKTFIVKAENGDKLKILASLLSKNGIEFGYGLKASASGFNYQNGKIERFSIAENDLVLSAYQPRSVLLKVLFEPNTFISDSVTYDITAWSIPYAQGLKAYAVKESLKPVTSALPYAETPALASAPAVAYAANWNSVSDVKFLTVLLKKNIRVRYSEVPFELAGRKLNAGSLLITRTGNEALGTNFDKTLSELAAASSINLLPVKSGLSETGPDLGSGKIKYLQKPRIAVLGGQGASSAAFGEVWHFFEQQLGFPVSVINAQDLLKANLYDFNVIIAPDGNYEALVHDKMLAWIEEGGKLIAMEGAVSQLAGKKGYAIAARGEVKAKDSLAEELVPYAMREREAIKSSIPGAIFKIKLDNTHPLAFGFPDFYYTLKLDDKTYSYLTSGWNVGTLSKDSYVTGFAGAETKKKLLSGLVFGVQNSGRGSIVYLADNPLFRGFWENGKLLFSNAVFMVAGE